MSKERVEYYENDDERQLSPIQRFLCICAGVDKEILNQCPTEWNKYTGIGATILFTGILASLSGGYALYTVFRDGDLSTIDVSALFPAFLFGILWGLIIFNLDRFIVSTFRKSDSGSFWKRLYKELFQASPRIILAVIIAIVISKPIEIKIFETRLAEQIKLNKIAAIQTTIDGFNAIHQLGAKEGRVNALDATITNLQTELTTDPQNVKDLINVDLEKADAELTRVRTANNPKIKANENARYEIYKNPNSYIYTTDSLGNKINTGNYTQNAKDRRYALYQEIQGWQKEIGDKQAEVTKINQRIENERALYRQQKSQEISERKQEKDSAAVQLKAATATAEKESEEANKTTEQAFTNNFITQIEALGDLTDKDNTMNIVSWFLMLLFLTIELAPILTKLITKRGVYDEILDRQEYEIIVEQKEIISRINSEINALLKQAEDAAKLSADIKMQSDQYKSEAALRVNKTILDDIARKQQELALKAIDKWYEEEKRKLKG
jgi:hypothetical protein